METGVFTPSYSKLLLPQGNILWPLKKNVASGVYFHILSNMLMLLFLDFLMLDTIFGFMNIYDGDLVLTLFSLPTSSRSLLAPAPNIVTSRLPLVILNVYTIMPMQAVFTVKTCSILRLYFLPYITLYFLRVNTSLSPSPHLLSLARPGFLIRVVG